MLQEQVAFSFRSFLGSNEVRTCPRCKQSKPISEFHRDNRKKTKIRSRCITCNKETKKPQKFTNEQRKKWKLFNLYRISVEEYDRIFKRQEGLCAICKKLLTRPRVDHDHVTGRVRGLLCQRCNLRLAGVEDDNFRKAAIEYIGLKLNV